MKKITKKLCSTVCALLAFSGNRGGALTKEALHLTKEILCDFILYCEMDIIRMNRNLDVLWDYSARDIFVRFHGDEPAFEMDIDRIKLYDFSDYYYEIDYDGKIIRD